MSMKTFTCKYCGKVFTNPYKYSGHISAHKRGFLGGTKVRTEAHKRVGDPASSASDLVGRIMEDPRIIGDVAVGVSKFLEAIGFKERRRESVPPEAELERKIGRTVLNAVVRQAAKQLTRQLEPVIRAQTELAIVGSELERTVLEEGKPEVASRMRVKELGVPTVVEHVIPEEDVEEAFG